MSHLEELKVIYVLIFVDQNQTIPKEVINTNNKALNARENL